MKNTPKKQLAVQKSVVESLKKKDLEHWSKEAKEGQCELQPGSEEKKEREAKQLVVQSCKVIYL